MSMLLCSERSAEEYGRLNDPVVTRSLVKALSCFSSDRVGARFYLGARTVIVNDARAVLAPESVAAHLTVLRPTLNWLPDLGMQVTGTCPSLASVAVTL